MTLDNQLHGTTSPSISKLVPTNTRGTTALPKYRSSLFALLRGIKSRNMRKMGHVTCMAEISTE